MEDFQYVVERKKPDPICFGSKVLRDTNPIGRGMSAFQKRYATELFQKTGPQTYHTENITSSLYRVQNKVRSRRGVGGLANGAERFTHKIFTQVPFPTRYNPKEFSKPAISKKAPPFGSKAPRKFPLHSKTPGAGTYNIPSQRCHRTRVAYNFGMPKPIPAVQVVCLPNPTDKCEKCCEICTTEYWYKIDTAFLCHPCYMEENLLHEMFTEKELMEYKRIRTCYFLHSHEGTTAAIRLLPRNEIVSKARVENYLNVFDK